MVKLQEANNRFFVSIPKEYIKKKKWVKGIDILVSFNERGNIELCDTK
ncbi:MAG: hypothetical protein U9Q22_00820 [Candidatus Altiarchaeota archaeon]|nr:hypothetical protein [Candidatus Altiarchaeota archaeon]